MKVEFPDSENFIIKPGKIAGEICFLINPQFAGTKWTRENLIFRSSIWNSKGEPVSLSFPKFFNWGERPDLSPTPKDIRNCELIEKIDGSTLVVSKYKGELIIRARGTFDAKKLDNGHEINYLLNEHPCISRLFDEQNSDVSWIFEWVSPVNKIVINYGDKPDLYLIGAIRHSNYSLYPQKALDEFAIYFGVKRPKRFNFGSIPEMLEAIEKLQGQEGLCLYFNNDQQIRKVKSAWYLSLHSLKSNLTTDKLADMWFLWNQPNYKEYCDKFVSTFDFECLQFASAAISKLFDGVGVYKDIINALQAKYHANKHLSRKEYAIEMLKNYGSTKKFTIMMNFFSNQETKTEVLKHILLQNTRQMELGIFKNHTLEEE